MRERVERVLFLSILAVAVLLLTMMFYLRARADNDARIYNVSVLVRAPSDRFIRGIEQAALDFNVDLHIMSGYLKNDSEQQIEYLARELDNNADAVVLYPEEFRQMESYLTSLRNQPPVVTVAQSLQDGRLALHVGPDNTAIGLSLAEQVSATGFSECLILCPSEWKPFHVERREALSKALADSGISVSVAYCKVSSSDVAQSLMDNRASVIVAVDENLLIPMCESARQDDILFGVGYVGNARPYLESGRIRALVVYSEYDEGYLSLRTAVRATGNNDAQNTTLDIYTANAGNMYSEPLVNILFPIG